MSNAANVLRAMAGDARPCPTEPEWAQRGRCSQLDVAQKKIAVASGTVCHGEENEQISVTHLGSSKCLGYEPCNGVSVNEVCVFQENSERNLKPQLLAAAVGGSKLSQGAQQIIVKDAVEKGEGRSLGTDNLFPRSASLEPVQIGEHVAKAVTKIKQTFELLEARVSCRHRKDLGDIEINQWRQLDIVQAKRRRLNDLLEKLGTLVKLKKSLTNGEVDERNASHLSHVIERNFTELTAGLDLEQCHLNRERISITPDELALVDAMSRIQSLFKIREFGCLYVEDAEFSVPDVIVFGQQCDVDVVFPAFSAPAGSCVQAMRCFLSSPSGQCTTIALLPSPSGSSKVLSLRATFTPDVVGEHALRLVDKDNEAQSCVFRCEPPILWLDRAKCTSAVMLSDDDHTATNNGPSGRCATAVARDGYTKGRHAWRAKINSTAQGCAFGLAMLPSSDDSNRTDLNLYRYGWYSSGGCFAYPQTRTDECHAFKEGDVATFTLDCELKTLEMHHHRTGERRFITGFKCYVQHALYPAFTMALPGNSISFC